MAPSPQFTVIDETVPSTSDAAKFMITTCPVVVDPGDREVLLTIGGRSFTVSDVLPDPDPPPFVAVTLIVND